MEIEKAITSTDHVLHFHFIELNILSRALKSLKPALYIIDQPFIKSRNTIVDYKPLPHSKRTVSLS